MMKEKQWILWVIVAVLFTVALMVNLYKTSDAGKDDPLLKAGKPATPC